LDNTKDDEKFKNNKNMRMLTKIDKITIKKVSTKHIGNTKGDRLEMSLFLFVEWVDASYDGSKVAKVLVPKVHINGKINTRMEKTLKNNV
jgi:hypothetical protein